MRITFIKNKTIKNKDFVDIDIKIRLNIFFIKIP